MHVKSSVYALTLATLVAGLGLFQPLASARKPQSPEMRFAAQYPALQDRLKSLQSWTVLLYQPETRQTLGLYPAAWNQPSIPASTFKVPNALIGLSAGVVNLETVFPWNGQKYELEGWNRDHTLASAMRVSCVPCFQTVARKIGLERMRAGVQKLQFGQMDVRAANLDRFWLEGKSAISPQEQAQFMAKLALRQHPFPKKHQDSVAQLIADPDIPGLHAKTGWGRVPHQGFGDSLPGQVHFGWYVGYYQSAGKTWAFATRLIAKDTLPEGFAALRKEVTLAYLRSQQIVN